MSESQIKERPILFNAEMVRAILAGKKTQTRRAAKGMALEWLEGAKFIPEYVASPDNDMCPNGKIGDQIWVRETFGIVPRTAYAQSDNCPQVLRPDDDHDAAIFRADWCRSAGGIRWQPSIHMPRWASRIQLEITNVRLERLNDISEEDAKAEGVSNAIFNSLCQNEKALPAEWPVEELDSEKFVFAMLWNSIYKNWDANPWVWVIEFKVIKP